MKRLFTLFFILIAMAMAFSVGQMSYTPVKADEETGDCCATSSTCAGTKVCQSPPNWLACCPANVSSCPGVGYCLNPLNE